MPRHPGNGTGRPPPRQLASVKAAAERYDVNERTVRRWAAAGLITAYRVGTMLVKVDLNEIDERVVRVIPAAEVRP
jgi:excisionase family DNA binding protein